MNKRKLISIICPVFNEEGTIPIFYKRLNAALQDIRTSFDFEIIFTNNRSTDRTLEMILELRRSDPAVQVLTLSRNFGYQASVMAGLRHALGDAIIVIDVDCEDPPEMIPRFVAEWEQGYDVVYGKREGRPESVIIKGMRKLFYRINRKVADNEVILDMAEFALISAHVRDAMLDNHSTFPFLRAEVGYAGFHRKGIPYDRERRVYGKSYYNFIGMTKFAIGGILSSSTLLLRAAAYLFPFVMALNLILLGVDLLADSVGAFHALVVGDLTYVIGLATILCIYQARIYKDSVSRPVFIVDWRLSVLNGASNGAVTERLSRPMWTTNRESRGLVAAVGDAMPPLTVPGPQGELNGRD